MRSKTLVALVALPLLLAACGGGSSSAPQVKLTPVAYVKQAATKTSQAQSEHVEMKATVGVQGQSVVITGTGDFDNSSHRGSMHAAFTVAGLNGTLDDVMDGTTMYMKSPLFAAALPQGKTWMKVDLQKVGAAKGFDFSALMGQDPAQSFAQLQAAGTVTPVGDETLDGVATTHYTVKVDVSKLPQGAKIAALTNVKTIPYDVWIGKDDGLVRRVRMAYSYAPPGAASGTATMNMSMDFSDFGKTVSIDVPAASDTFDATGASLKGIGG